MNEIRNLGFLGISERGAGKTPMSAKERVRRRSGGSIGGSNSWLHPFQLRTVMDVTMVMKGNRWKRLAYVCVVSVVLVLVAPSCMSQAIQSEPPATYPPSSATGTGTQSTVSLLPTSLVTLRGCACDQTSAQPTGTPSLEACDPNCCCDPDCASTHTALFSDSVGGIAPPSTCRPEGPDTPQLEYCAEADVAKVNLPSSSSFGSVRRVKAQDGVLSSQLCIVQDNNVAYGAFFADPATATPAVAVAVGKNDPNFYEWLEPDATAAASGALTAFDTRISFTANESVPFAFNVTGLTNGLRTDESGVFRLNARVYSAACDDIDVLGFLFDSPFTARQRIATNSHDGDSCEVSYTNLATQCTTQSLFDVRSYVDTQWLGQFRLAPIASAPTGYVAVEMANITRVDLYTGAATAAQPAAATPPGPSFDAVSGSCRDVVVKMHYTIFASASGSITRVLADATLAEAIVPPSTGVGAVPITYTATWREDGRNLGTTAKVRQSGSPGYSTYFPVLAGMRVSNVIAGTSSVEHFVEGFPFPTAAPTDGSCSFNFQSPLGFGASTASGCTVAMTLRQLREFCTLASPTNAFGTYLFQTKAEQAAPGCANTAISPGGSTPLPAQIMQGFGLSGLVYVGASGAGALAGDATRQAVVGAWGNADYAESADWIPIETNAVPPPSSMVWDEASSTCSNVLNRFSIEFLVGGVGPVYDVQRKIMHAQTSYSSDAAWTWTGSDVNCTKDFDVHFSASFVQLAQTANEGDTPDPPPLAPTFPSDIFYPFLSSSTPAGATAASIAVAVLIIAIGLCLPILR